MIWVSRKNYRASLWMLGRRNQWYSSLRWFLRMMWVPTIVRAGVWGRVSRWRRLRGSEKWRKWFLGWRRASIKSSAIKKSARNAWRVWRWIPLSTHPRSLKSRTVWINCWKKRGSAPRRYRSRSRISSTQSWIQPQILKDLTKITCLGRRWKSKMLLPLKRFSWRILARSAFRICISLL